MERPAGLKMFLCADGVAVRGDQRPTKQLSGAVLRDGQLVVPLDLYTKLCEFIERPLSTDHHQ
jgi:hypothetical protein